MNTTRVLSFTIVQAEVRVNHHPIAEARNPSALEKPPGDESPNVISENIVKCLASILLRMSRNCVEGTEVWDPYGVCSDFGNRDIGPYKQLCAIEAKSFDPKRTANSLFLLCRLKYVTCSIPLFS